MKIKLIIIVCVLFVIGKAQAQEKMNVLSLKDRQVAAISGSAAKGDKEGLTIAIISGLDAGLTVNEIKEVLVQLYAYAGFPRSMGALSTFMEVLQQRKTQGIEDVEGAVHRP